MAYSFPKKVSAASNGIRERQITYQRAGALGVPTHLATAAQRLNSRIALGMSAFSVIFSIPVLYSIITEKGKSE